MNQSKGVKYLIRSLKYLVWFAALFFIFIFIIVLVSNQYSFNDLFSAENGMFKPGSLPKIIVFFIAIAAIYPALSFVKKEVIISKTFDDHRERIFEIFKSYGYCFVSEDEESVTFRIEKPYLRFMRMYEDQITLTKGEAPLILNGMRKEITRLASAIEYATRNDE